MKKPSHQNEYSQIKISPETVQRHIAKFRMAIDNIDHAIAGIPADSGMSTAFSQSYDLPPSIFQSIAGDFHYAMVLRYGATEATLEKIFAMGGAYESEKNEVKMAPILQELGINAIGIVQNHYTDIIAPVIAMTDKQAEEKAEEWRNREPITLEQAKQIKIKELEGNRLSLGKMIEQLTTQAITIRATTRPLRPGEDPLMN